MRLTKPFVGLAVASLLALAACGGGGSSPESSSQQSSELNNVATGNMDPTAVGPLTIAGATSGGTVHVIGLSGDMSTSFDPRGVYYSDMISIQTSLLVRSLTQWKYDDKTGDMVLVPDLATNLGTSNKNYTTWTFHIQPNIKYQNGTVVTTKDIAYSVSSSLNCSVFTDCPANYFLGSLKGYNNVPKNGIASGISTPNDTTIVFHFTKPFPDMSYYSYFPLFSPIPEAQGKDLANYQNNILATGPYEVKKFVPGKSLDLVRNPEWVASTDPARAALPDAWDFDTTYTDPKKVDAIIKASKGDGATTLSYDDIFASDIPSFKSSAPDQISTGSTPLTEWLAPDSTKVPLAVRQALTWAYPYKAAAKTGGLIPGINWLPTTTLIAPGVPGRQVVNAVAGHKAGETDAAKAKAILQKAGDLGFKVSWLYDTDVPTSVNVEKIVAAAYKKAGLDPAPYATTSTDYAELRSDPSTPINIRTGGWFSDWPSGFSWIPPVFAPPTAGQACAKQKWASFGVVNFAHFCEDDVNKMITQNEAKPLADQPAGWSALEKYIQTKYYPVIPLYNGGTIQAHGTNIEGDNIDITGGMPTFKTVWVKQ
jgi:peptide/nickel transport system substrate-binding protein